MTSALVVGYGNSMRTDDGLGWHAAQHLSDDPRLAGTVVLQRHQLLPELAYDISVVDLVVFVDATTAQPPGHVAVEEVQRVEPSGSTWSHHVSPSTLLALSEQLYGRAADAFVVSCGMQSVEMGDRLSPAVEAAMPQVIDAVVELLGAAGA